MVSMLLLLHACSNAVHPFSSVLSTSLVSTQPQPQPLQKKRLQLQTVRYPKLQLHQVRSMMINANFKRDMFFFPHCETNGLRFGFHQGSREFLGMALCCCRHHQWCHPTQAPGTWINDQRDVQTFTFVTGQKTTTNNNHRIVGTKASQNFCSQYTVRPSCDSRQLRAVRLQKASHSHNAAQPK